MIGLYKIGGHTFGFVLFIIILLFFSCTHAQRVEAEGETLIESLNGIVSRVPGCVGVAFVSDRDTVLINNGVRFPMMSVFKLHEALAVCNKMERRNNSLDSLIRVAPEELDKETWSPMLKEYGDSAFNISVGELIRYALKLSDNNASNILFNRIVSPQESEEYIRSFAADTSFSMRWREQDMKRNHDLAYANYTSPMAVALLIRNLFTADTPSLRDGEFVRNVLAEVTTGQDRLGAPIQERKNVLFAHKTGSGYRNNHGELAAHNDVGYFRLEDGKDYSLAVLIRDFHGSETEASAIIAEISRLIFNHVSNEK